MTEFQGLAGTIFSGLVGYAWSAAKFGLAVFVLVLIHEFGHFLAARKIGVRVEIFSLGFGKKLFIRKKGNTDYAISAIPLGGYVKLAGDNIDEKKGAPDEFLSKPAGKRFWVLFMGPLMNYIMAIVFFCTVYFIGYPYLSTKVGLVRPEMGAARAGIRVGDTIVAVEGKRVKMWDELSAAVRSNGDKEKVAITVFRDGREEVVPVDLTQQVWEGPLKEKRKIGMIGISPDPKEVIRLRYSLFESIGLGIKRTLSLTAMTYQAFGSVISKKIPLGDSVTGPVGIWDLFSAVETMADFLQLTALLSLSLAVFNLLPLPALDGSHILLLGIEKIRGRYVSKKTENILGQVGMGFILLLAVFVTYNDLSKKGFFEKTWELMRRPFVTSSGDISQ